MAYIIETINPLEPLTGLKKHQHDGGVSIRQWLELEYPGFQEFSVPTICLVNGVPLLRKDWNHIIGERDIVNFIAVAGGPGALVILLVLAIVLTAAAIGLTVYTLLTAHKAGSIPTSDPVFTLKGQNNANRLAEPIEVNYGKNRIFPSLASIPYYNYSGNNQFQYSLFCIGVGHYQIGEILIGDTPIGNFPDISYQVCPPGTPVTLFPTNVYVSTDAGGQQMYGSNEPAYVAPGYVGPFEACPAGYTIDSIRVDVIFPKGLYVINSNNSIGSAEIDCHFEAQLIDDSGNPLGAWFEFADASLVTATTTPQRRTVGSQVPVGRYQVRGIRTNLTNLSVNAGNDVVWDGMRSYLSTNVPNYGNVTILAVIAQATNVLNSNSQDQYNVIATRMLPVRGFTYEENSTDYTATFGGVLHVATRSLPWAFVDVFMSSDGANISDLSFFDWDALNELDALYSARGEYFDWTFRDPITVWDAATAIGLVGRAVPMIVGSLISLIRDNASEIPVTLFTPDNIIKDSFEWDITLWDANDYDSILASYIDPTTGYVQEQVLVTLPGGTTNYPSPVTYSGVGDRTMAYRLALYQLAVAQYIRENIVFSTGMEGFIPSYGDLIAVCFDATEWGQSGYVVAVEELTTGSYSLYLSEPLDFAESGQIYQMYLRDKAGDAVGPVNVIPTSDPLTVEIELASDMDFLLGGNSEPLLFLFGIKNQVTKLCKIARIEPQGSEAIKITAVNYNPIIYTFDDQIPIPIGNPAAFFPQPNNAWSIQSIYAHQVQAPSLLTQVSWTPVPGAWWYVVQVSYDGTNFSYISSVGTQCFSTSFTFLPVSVGALYIQVRAVGSAGQGPVIEVGLNIGQVIGLALLDTWNNFIWEIGWQENGIAGAYLVVVYDNTNPASPVLKRSTVEYPTLPANTYTYSYSEALPDGNVVRNMLVTVDTMYWDQDSTTYIANGFPSSLALTHAYAPAPTSPAAAFYELNSAGEKVYHFSWVNPSPGYELIRVRLWISTVNNFDPTVVSPVYDDYASTPGRLNVPNNVYLPVVPGHVYYWRVSLADVWGNEITTSITAQQSFSA